MARESKSGRRSGAVVALASGVASWMTSCLLVDALPSGVLDDAAFYSPGLIFGWAVLAPAMGSVSARSLRQIGIVLGSCATYFIAVQFVFQTQDDLGIPGACAVAGVLGAGLLVALLRPVARYHPSISTLLRITAWCLAGGVAIGLGFELGQSEFGLSPEGNLISDDPPPWEIAASQALRALGFVTWQWGFAVSTVLTAKRVPAG